jgi:hypothetical protein
LRQQAVHCREDKLIWRKLVGDVLWKHIFPLQKVDTLEIFEHSIRSNVLWDVLFCAGDAHYTWILGGVL